ncbi:sensor histidine kinase [Arsenicicoccus piscis]|uniref:histidine kinase n=1 Tax=Arsenicicoccus piscis TaxID=673954 RepID=UPI001F4C8C55|nr:sensor histidine kinase [Arsenicicoccus piscis]
MHPARAGRVVSSMTAVQHVLFALLLVIGLVRAVQDGAATVPLLLATLALVGWYAAGARLGRRAQDQPSAPRPALGAWFLLGLALVWVALVLISHELVWLAFSLWLLAGHLMTTRVALPFSLAVLGVVVAAPWHALGAPPGAAGIIGPAVGAAFALALSRGQQRLVRENIERRRLVESLVRAQAESELLHAELASAQRESGILAERTRLSRDIHDTLAQGFSSILLLARAGAVADADRRAELLAQIEATASDNLVEARRVVGALAPQQLEGSGLASALRRILDAQADETGVATELRVEGDLASLPTVVEVALLRAAQGALANVREHSAARHVVVTLTESDDSVRLDVVDDGRGFDAAAWARAAPSAPELGGYGLRSSRARLRELGGGLEIESQAGSGTALSAYVPLTQAFSSHPVDHEEDHR